MGPRYNCVGRTDRVSEPRESSCASGRFLGECNGGEGFWGTAWLQVSFQDYDVGAEAHIFFFLIIFYIGVSQLGSSLVAQLVKNLPTMQETLV